MDRATSNLPPKTKPKGGPKQLKLPLIPLPGNPNKTTVKAGPKSQLVQSTKSLKEDTTATPSKNEESFKSTVSEGKRVGKFTFADLFRDEGMYHSVQNNVPVVKMLRQANASHTSLLKTPMHEAERFEEEQELRRLEQDGKYNKNVFDRAAIREIEKQN